VAALPVTPVQSVTKKRKLDATGTAVVTTTTTTTIEPFTPGASSTPLKNKKGQPVQRFQRVKADEVSFSHDGLADNSFDARVSLLFTILLRAVVEVKKLT
jgi:hypothetical protein